MNEKNPTQSGDAGTLVWVSNALKDVPGHGLRLRLAHDRTIRRELRDERGRPSSNYGSVRRTAFVLMDNQGTKRFQKPLALLFGGSGLSGEFGEPVVNCTAGAFTGFAHLCSVEFLQCLLVQRLPLNGHRDAPRLWSEVRRKRSRLDKKM